MANNPFVNSNMPKASAPAPGTKSTSSMSDAFEVDLTDVQQNGFTIDDGKYRVKCIDIEQSVSQGGNPMFVWTFEIVDGKFAGFQSKVFTAITPAAMWKVAETVVALGVGQQGQVVKFNRKDVINKDCGAIFEQSEYKGQMRSQITKIIPLNEITE